jgi:translation initiation factor IF-2
MSNRPDVARPEENRPEVRPPAPPKPVVEPVAPVTEVVEPVVEPVALPTEPVVSEVLVETAPETPVVEPVVEPSETAPEAPVVVAEPVAPPVAPVVPTPAPTREGRPARPGPRTDWPPLTRQRGDEPTMERAVIVERPGGPVRPSTPIQRTSMPRSAQGGGNNPPPAPSSTGPVLPGLGLGRAVVSLPAGYDPTDPTGARRRAREAASQPQQRWTQTPAAPAGPRRDPRQDQPAPSPVNDPGGASKRKPRSKERAEVVLDERLRRAKARPSQPLKPTAPKGIKRKLRIDGEITVANLAHELGVKAAELVKLLMTMGQPATINQFIDFDTATIIASDYNAEVVNVAFDESDIIVKKKVVDKEKELSRPPVVTVMGHVDHGKTTLLDTIRKARVASGEAGGITQHIGAYQIKRGDRLITFIDTPGHAAFSAMRARGAKATDIVVLVVAADDGVMPQTIEAINHAKAANVPIVVAVNKCDKPGIQPERIRQMLMEHGLVPEEFGGDTMFANVSALKGTGVDDLLDNILLVAEIADMRANPLGKGEGVVLEARLETGKGAVASLLVQNGTLRQGDQIVIGTTWGRVRAMADDRGAKLKEAGPSTPVEIFGLQDLPNAGDSFAVVESERDARSLVEHRQEKEKASGQAQRQKLTVDDLFKMGANTNELLHLVLKTDVSGSLEALKSALEAIAVSGTQLKVLHAGVGPVNESDINLAAAEKAMVIAFNVKADAKARQAADSQNVEIRRYDVIYAVIDEIKARLLGMLAPVYEERRIGEAEVRAIFNIAKMGQVAGCMVVDGKLVRNSTVKVLRNNKQVFEAKVSGLRRFKDDVKEVEKGFECGVSLEGNTEIMVNDRLVFYTQVEVPRTS